MKNITINLLLLLLLSAALLLPGCGSRHADPSSADEPGYRTIPTQLGRDTDLAKRRTAQAMAAIQEGQLEEAETLLRQALEADVMHGPAHNNLGQVYFGQQRYYEAAWEFQYAIRLMPHQPIPRNNLGLVFEATGQLQDAAQQYELAVAEEPDNPQLLGNLARVKVRNGETGAEVRDLLLQVVMKDNRPEWRQWAEEQLRFMPNDGEANRP